MKKYILLFITTLVLLIVLIVGIKETNDHNKVMVEFINKRNQVCEQNNGTYINSAGIDVCKSFDGQTEYKVEVKDYITDVDAFSSSLVVDSDTQDELESDIGLPIFEIGKFIMYVLISVESIWFVKDFLSKAKVTKKNIKEIKDKCILVSLIPTIPLMVYGVIKGISPLLFGRDALILNMSSYKFIANYSLTYVLLAIITGLIGLVVSTRNTKWHVNISLIVSLMIVYHVCIIIATLLINSVFVMNYEGLFVIGALYTCTAQTLLYLLTAVAGLLLYKFLPSNIKSK